MSSCEAALPDRRACDRSKWAEIPQKSGVLCQSAERPMTDKRESSGRSKSVWNRPCASLKQPMSGERCETRSMSGATIFTERWRRAHFIVPRQPAKRPGLSLSASRSTTPESGRKKRRRQFFAKPRVAGLAGRLRADHDRMRGTRSSMLCAHRGIASDGVFPSGGTFKQVPNKKHGEK
jgi:hypothetical protein